MSKADYLSMRVGLIQSTENKNKGPSGGETKEDAMGLLDNEAFLCPPFLACREQTPASAPFPEFQRADSKMLIREGRRCIHKGGAGKKH